VLILGPLSLVAFGISQLDIGSFRENGQWNSFLLLTLVFLAAHYLQAWKPIFKARRAVKRRKRRTSSMHIGDLKTVMSGDGEVRQAFFKFLAQSFALEVSFFPL